MPGSNFAERWMRAFLPGGLRATYADLAHLVERHLAKVEVASSSLVIRSKKISGRGTSRPEIFIQNTIFCIAKDGVLDRYRSYEALAV